MKKEIAVPPLTNFLGFNSAGNTIKEARAVLNAPDKTKWPEAERTVKATLISLAEALNIQQCDPVTIVDRPSSAMLEFNLKTGELSQILPGGQKIVENPLTLIDNADKILPIFKELAIASLPAS